ncbi:9562_t:CDS:2 [Entrophospora sp. SA101]|nr:9562_t:CDS:2 [Entrophospora sp. SA101]
MDLKLICQESATNASTTEAATVTSMTINSKNKAIDLKIDNDNSQQTQSLPPSEFGNDNNAIAPTSTSQSHSQLQQFPSQQLTAVAVTSQPSSSSRSSTPSAPPPQSHLQQGQLLTPPYNKEGHISDLINKTFEVLYALNALKDETIRKGPKRLAPPGRCHSCNIQETPEWRRGPDGARTLCNACGLHFAKLTRKRSQAAMLEHQRFQEYYTR